MRVNCCSAWRKTKTSVVGRGDAQNKRGLGIKPRGRTNRQDARGGGEGVMKPQRDLGGGGGGGKIKRYKRKQKNEKQPTGEGGEKKNKTKPQERSGTKDKKRKRAVDS